MPFVIEKKGDQYCVYTQGSDGEAEGSPHGCHPTYEQARQQQKALYANVPDARKAKPAEKPDGHKSPPKGYPTDRDEYADPTNYKYPLDTEAHARNALSRWGDASNREGYSSEEQAYIKARILAACRKFGVEVASTKTEVPMILFGAAVKAMGDGLVGGYLIQYGSEATKDAEGEWFTQDTDFDTDFPARASIYYHHGCDPSIGRQRLTHGKMERDHIGVRVEGKLNLSDPKQAAIYRCVERGEMGWSSGSLPHITIPPRENPGGAIKQWPLGHDASLTRIPSDRRNAAVAIKSAPLPPVEELIPACECGGVKSTSLAENTERWLETGEILVADYKKHAVKAGRKLSAARRERLLQMRSSIDEMLSETEPREEAAVEEVASNPVTGEEASGGQDKGRVVFPVSIPDISDLYSAAVRQSSGPILSGRI